MSEYEERERRKTYRVVVNDEEQYSIWLAHKDVPAGWRDVGTSGDKDECLAYIQEVWTDMRPKSVRLQMEERAESLRPPPAADEAPTEAEVDELVLRLSEGRHPVTASPGNHRTWEGLRERIEIGVVHVRFTETRTELGVRLLPEHCDYTRANLEKGTGQVRLVGRLILNDVPVRCIADIVLPELSGQGHLEPLEEPARHVL